MSTDLCGAPHPERPTVACDRPEHRMAGFHRSIADGLVWDGEPLEDRRPIGRAGLAALAAGTARGHRTGPPV